MSTLRHLPLASILLLCGTGLAGAAKIKAPTPPSNLTVKPLGINSFELKWKDNSKNEVGWDVFAGLKGSTPSHYQWLETPNINTFVVITNELPGKAVSFQLAAYNGTIAAPKRSKRTSVVTATAFSKSTFAAPSKFRVSGVDDGQCRLLWKDNATKETGYQMEYKVSSAKVWTPLGATNPGTSFSLPVAGLQPSTNYSFRVRAFNVPAGAPAVYTRYSPVVKMKTKDFQAPANLEVTPEADGAFSFKWKDQSSVETGFELQRKVGAGEFAVFGSIVANATFITPTTGFDLNADHQFRLRGTRLVDGKVVYSGFSNLVSSKSTSLAAPLEFAGTATSETAVTVTWKESSLRANGHVIEYRAAGTNDPFTAVNVGKVLTGTLSNLAAGKLYEIRLKAISRDLFGTILGSSANTPSLEIRAKDGIIGGFHPPIFWDTSFLYPVQISRVSALTSLAVTGLPAGLTYDPTDRTIKGKTTVEGAVTVTLKATFSDASEITRNLILRIIRPPTGPVSIQPFAPVQLAVAASTPVSLAGKFADPDTTSAARLETTAGRVDVILYPLATPVSVTNFLSYFNGGSYKNSFFHRSVAQASGSLFIVQGGGYQHTPETGFTRVTKLAAIANEPGISNLEGTIAMAKVGGNPNSATSEFFINLSDVNASNLDAQNEGFTVFGRVSTPGLAVMKAVNALKKKNYNVLIGAGTQSLTDVPTLSENTAIPLDPALLVKVTASIIPPLLTYEAVSESPAVATASVAGTTVTVTGVTSGSATIRVKATDLDGQSVSQDLKVTVP